MPAELELRRDFPVTMAIPVNWGDQDAFGHVNNTVYLRWSETARILYLDKVGLWQRYLTEKVGPILAAITCNYRLPVEYPDTIVVGARVASLGNSSFRMEHRVISTEKNAVVAELDSTLVLFDYNTGRSTPLTPELRNAIAAVEDGTRA